MTEKNGKGNEPAKKQKKRGLGAVSPFALEENLVGADEPAEQAPENAPADPPKKKKSGLRASFPFALSEEEQAQLDEHTKTKEDSPKRVRSPFALEENLLGTEDDLDSQLEQEEEEPAAQLPMDRDLQDDSAQEPEQTQKKHKRRWYGIPVGTLVLCFAVIGMTFVIMQGYRWAYSHITDDSAQRAYDTYLSPVVMLDPEPFESITAAEKTTVLEAAIWATVFDHLEEINSYDEQARLIVPADMVKDSALRLFGVGCILTPTDIYLPQTGLEEGVPEATITYVEEEDAYHVPLIPTVGTYTPYTTSIRHVGNKEYLRVAYCILLDSTASVTDMEVLGEGLGVVKYMEYEISYDEDMKMQYISAIRTVEE